MTTESTIISGPINVIRLEGKTDNINKTLYVLFDIHVPLRNQTECLELQEINIKNYISNNLKLAQNENNIIYDLFIEYHPVRDIDKFGATKYTVNYIEEMMKFITKQYYLDNNNIRKRNSYYKNLRSHYIDFRFPFMSPKITETIYYLESLCYNIHANLSIQNLQLMIDNLKIIKSFYIHTFNTFFKPRRITATDLKLLEYTNKSYKQIEHKISNKIIGKYNHKSVKKVLGNIIKNEFKTELLKYTDELDLYINTLTDFCVTYATINFQDMLYNDNIKTYTRGGVDFEEIDKIIKFVHQMGSNLFQSLGGATLYIMDMYFLRRFLDKDYVTNGIVYTGAEHSVNYIYLLVKYFDFKITHFSYIKKMSDKDNIKNINNVHKNIKASINYINCIKYFFPTELYQCSDISGFPKLFL